MRQIDAFVAHVNDQFSLHLEAYRPFDYVHVPSQALLDEKCNRSDSGGCARGNTAYSLQWAHLHEVAHSIFFSIGEPPALFQEGIAEMLDCGVARWRGPEVNRLLVDGLLTSAQWMEHDNIPTRYASASFVRFLLDSHGAPAFFSFYARARYSDDETSIRAAFKGAFGATAEEALAQWRSRPRELAGEYCLMFSDACDSTIGDIIMAPGIEWEDAWSCVDRAVSFDASQATSARLTVSADRRFLVTAVRPCDVAEQTRRVVAYPVGVPYEDPLRISESEYRGRAMELWTSLRPGRYSVIVSSPVPAEAGGAVTVSGTASSLPLVSECGSAEVWSVPDEVWSVVIAVPPGDPLSNGAAYLPFRVSGPRSVTDYTPTYYPSRGGGLLCPNCGSDWSLDCDALGASLVPADRTVILALPSPPEPDRYARILFRPPE